MATLAYSTYGSADAEGNLPKTLTTGNVAVAAGDLIVAYAVDGAGNAIFGDISDSAGNTFVQLAQGGGAQVRGYYCLAAANASATDVFTVSCTGTGYSFLRLLVSVYTVDGYTLSYVGTSYVANYSTAIDTGDLSSTKDNSVWVAGVKTTGPRTHSNQTIAGSAATVISGFDGRINMFYRILSSTATDDAQDTLDSASSWEVNLYVFDAEPKASPPASLSIYLHAGHANPADIVLRDPTLPAGGAWSLTDVGGIPTAEAFGLAVITVTGGDHNLVDVGGIASLEAFGSLTLSASVVAGSIASLEAIGQPVVSAGIVAGSIASLEALGSLTLSVNVVAGSVASGEAFGQPVITASGASIVDVGGIASLEAFGQPSLTAVVSAQGIASLEEFGLLDLSASLTLQGIASGEAFGQPTVTFGAASIVDAGGISSLEAFGNLTLTVLVQAQGTASQEAFGQPSISTGVTLTGVGGIASAEAFGLAWVFVGKYPLPSQVQLGITYGPLTGTEFTGTLVGGGGKRKVRFIE